MVLVVYLGDCLKKYLGVGRSICFYFFGWFVFRFCFFDFEGIVFSWNCLKIGEKGL